MRKSITIGTIIFILLTMIIFFDKIISLIINISWFNEVGYLSVYFTRISATSKLMIPIFILCYLIIWIYYKGIRRNISRMKNVASISLEVKKREKKIFIVVDILISLLISYFISVNYWYKILQFANSAKFNLKDPIFNKDISFYIFKLPLIESIYQSAIGILILLVVLTLIVFFIMLASDSMISNIKKKSNIRGSLTQFAGKQLAIVSGALLFMGAIGYLLKCYNIIYSSGNLVYGAGYTDAKVTLLFYRIICAACFSGGVVSIISILRSRIKPIIIAVIIIGVLICSQIGISLISEKFIVDSNQISFEGKYIKYNIEYTKKAFNIDNIKEIQYKASNALTKDDIENNEDIIDNIKINSYKQSLDFYNQVQVMRYYYGFNDIDIDRYYINNKYTQVFISPREIFSDMINPDTWLNTHLIYTHGYGIVMSKVNSVTAEGQPDFIINDLPPNNKSEIKINNPRIYFGESTNDYAVVNTKSKEFDYPNGQDNKYSSYDGKAGIRMSWINKLLFAIKEREYNFLLSGYIKDDSKILINRNIVDRVKKIAPFLMYDSDPYIVISNEKLYWIIDAYTYSNKFPYSQPVGNINYIRNSVKVVIDAFDGDTNFYIIDKADPIVKSYASIFKGLFKDASEIPEDIKSHFRYPEDLFNIQCRVLAKFHTTDTMSFMTGEDQWDISENKKTVEGEKSVNEASYVVTRLPDSKSQEMVLLEYFNIKEKENMSAIIGARMDGENYGKLVLYKFPTNQTVYSPYLFKNKIMQDAVISKELSLWDTKGSRTEFGDTIIIPVNNSLFYLEPMYLIAEGKNSIPEMKRVIVSNGEKIVLAENMDDALDKLFNLKKDDYKATSNNISLSKEWIDQAKDIYNKAIEAQKQGDWTKYGEYINKLGEMLENAD